MAIDPNWKNYGVYVQNGIGSAYPELNAKLNKFYADKVGKIPWLPTGWLDFVQGLARDRSNDQVRIAPVYQNAATKTLSENAPDWLDNEDKRTTWQTLFTETNSIVQKYAQNDAAAGALELDILYAKAAFWNGAYNTAVFIADVPKKIVGAAGDFASGIASEFLKKWIRPIGLVAVGFIIYMNRGALAKAAGKKLGA